MRKKSLLVGLLLVLAIGGIALHIYHGSVRQKGSQPGTIHPFDFSSRTNQLFNLVIQSTLTQQNLHLTLEEARALVVTSSEISPQQCEKVAIKYGITFDDAKTLLQWRQGTQFSADYQIRAARIGTICLRNHLKKDDIVRIIGVPLFNYQSQIVYGLTLSDVISMYFESDGVIKTVRVSGRNVKLDGTLE